MSGAFQYKPRFKDIRVRPPKADEETKADDVYALKPGERPCEWAGCRAAATARAPKSREMMNEHYWFCQAHAGEYNKNWHFFAGMSDEEMAAAQAARASREAASFAARMGTGAGGKGAGAYADPLGVLDGAPRKPPKAPRRQLGRRERRSLEELDLDETADGPVIRTRYLELVKRFHPDSNGGDRSSEQKLTRVIRAYKTLQTAKLV